MIRQFENNMNEAVGVKVLNSWEFFIVCVYKTIFLASMHNVYMSCCFDNTVHCTVGIWSTFQAVGNCREGRGGRRLFRAASYSQPLHDQACPIIVGILGMCPNVFWDIWNMAEKRWIFCSPNTLWFLENWKFDSEPRYDQTCPIYVTMPTFKYSK